MLTALARTHLIGPSRAWRVWASLVLMMFGAVPAKAQVFGFGNLNIDGGCVASAGFLEYIERGKNSKDWTARGICVLSAGKNFIGVRGQLKRNQDASELTPKTVQSFDVYVAADRSVSPKFAIGALGGTFFDVDSGKNLRDPHQWTIGGYLKYHIKDGYALAGVGHVAPVGGLGLFLSVEIPKGDHVSFVIDAAMPTSRSRFLKNPYLITTGALLRK